MESQASVSILFSDIRDFTEFTAKQGDRQALHLLKLHTRLVEEAMQPWQGHLVKTYGDGVMLRFAQPQQALQAAVALQSKANAYTQQNPSMPLLVGIGIHAGAVIEENEDLFGLVVNLAKRLADEARSGQIIVSDAVLTFPNHQDDFTWMDLGTKPLKGIGDMHLFEIVWRQETLRLTTKDQTLNLILTHDDKLVIELGKHIRQELETLKQKLKGKAGKPAGVMGWVLQRSETWLPNLIEKALGKLGIGIEHDLADVRMWVEKGQPQHLLIKVGNRQFDLTQLDEKGFDAQALLAFLEKIHTRQNALGASMTKRHSSLKIQGSPTPNAPLLKSFFMALSHNRRAQHWFSSLPFSRQMIRRFVAGERLEQALEVAKTLNQKDIFATLNYLGEETATKIKATAATHTYLDLLDELSQANIQATISLKPTQLGLKLDPDFCRKNVETLLARAKQLDKEICLDMEGSPYTDLTLTLFESLFAQNPHLSTVLQANLKRTEADLQRLIQRGAPVRLVKGAYLEPPEIGYTSKREVDRAFVRLIERSLGEEARHRGVYSAIATHDESILKWTCQLIKKHRVPASAYEFQMLYGIRRDLQEQLSQAGHVVRVYVSYGQAWYPYFMRRLAERPANVLFLLKNLFKG